VVGLAAFLCLVITVVVAVLFLPKLLGEEPTPTEEATSVSEMTPSPTITLTVAPTPTETPTATPERTREDFQATVAIEANSTSLQVGDLLTVTVTVTNTGLVEFGNLHYQLLEELEPYLRATAGVVRSYEPNVPPGQSHTAIFVLEAQEAGTINIRANVTMEVRITPLFTDRRSSEPLEVSISSP